MRIYLIQFNEHDYDMYDAFVVIAQSAEEAESIIKSNEYDVLWNEGFTVREIVPQNELVGVVLESFNAG